MEGLQLDLSSAVLRIEQIGALPEGDPLRELLIDRLVRCDARRLRQYIGAAELELMTEIAADGPRVLHVVTFEAGPAVITEPRCRVYWGSHGCQLPRGHVEPVHPCTSSDCPPQAECEYSFGEDLR